MQLVLVGFAIRGAAGLVGHDPLVTGFCVPNPDRLVDIRPGGLLMTVIAL